MKKLYYILTLLIVIFFSTEGISLLLNKTIYKKKFNVDFNTTYFKELREKIERLDKQDLLNLNSTELYNEIINLKYYDLSNLEIKEDFF